MREWKKRAKIWGDVVAFDYVKSKVALESPLIYVWDIDKTYLDTHFESLRGLWRTALEKAFQKRNVPGANLLVKALNRAHRDASDKPFPIYFISASPPQMERKIREKLALDGITPLGTFFKDNLKNLKPSRWWRLSHHLGYKLQALLELRTQLKADVKQILWGDDSESDAVIYAMYSDICSRRLAGGDLVKILHALRVVGEQIETIFELVDQIPVQDPVGKIYINLAADTDPDYYLKFGRRMVVTSNSFQAALDLYQDGRLNDDEVLSIGQDLLTNYGYTPDELAASLDALVRRQVLGHAAVEKLLPLFHENRLVPAAHRSPPALMKLIQDESGFKRLADVQERWIPEYIDYLRESR
ncbi:MAG TPA: phosphatase domain-containing protein [Bdellovibrionales bacterium]|nr:phosphatase domain-containing protein [Bdellovibrionales bacterium]